MKPSQATLEKLTALCKRRGFVYQAAEIYSGLNGLYDFGNLGALMKENIRALWRKNVMSQPHDVLFLEGTLLGPEKEWEASGHLSNFHDPMVDCINCKHRYRADELDLNKACPNCGIKNWTEVRTFNMMFKTRIGAMEEGAPYAYLRPESAQSIFVNFKNIYSTNRVKIPFGVGQTGKAFRNEINPKHFLFRMREFEQMELEWFCKEEDAKKFFDFWCNHRLAFYESLGVTMSKIRLKAHSKEELSHYSQYTSDVEYEFPFGWKELEGIAYRGNYDLSQHSKFSGKDLAVFDQETGTSYIPHVVETSVGTDRLFLTLLFDSYCEDVVEGEERVVLKLDPKIAPIKAAILPLTKKLSEPAEKIYTMLKSEGYYVDYDESGSIGKRYRRNDEIGTPVCFTIDFETEKDNSVTVRYRDTTLQERISIDKIKEFMKDLLS
jgi:glycyl-tRNA synthetase